MEAATSEQIIVADMKALLGRSRNLVVGRANKFVGVRTVSTEKISIVEFVLRSETEMSGDGMRIDEKSCQESVTVRLSCVNGTYVFEVSWSTQQIVHAHRHFARKGGFR